MDTFNKVIGYEDIKLELNRIVDMMVNPDKYEELGVKQINGLLLDGVPGVGKTLMANCVIEASGLPVFVVRKDMPKDEFVKHIKETFDNAINKAPSIVFLDDMDKFSNQEKNCDEFITIQSCIDKYKNKRVFVIATANNTDAIPKSLLRSGRFDKTITVTCPERNDSEKIIEHYLKDKKCSKDIDTKEITKLLNGKTCAFLEGVINEAGIYAGYDNRKEISMNDIVKVFMRNVYDSPEVHEFKDNKYMLQTAYHEAGHIVVAEKLEPESVPFATIQPHNRGVQGFIHIENNDNYFEDRKYMENRVISLLAGRAATEIVFGVTDIGSRSDLNRAFEIVTRFIDDYCIYGFETFNCSHTEENEIIKEKRAFLVSYEIERYYQEAKRIVIENRAYLDALANELFDKKYILSKDIKRLKDSTDIINNLNINKIGGIEC